MRQMGGEGEGIQWYSNYMPQWTYKTDKINIRYWLRRSSILYTWLCNHSRVNATQLCAGRVWTDKNSHTWVSIESVCSMHLFLRMFFNNKLISLVSFLTSLYCIMRKILLVWITVRIVNDNLLNIDHSQSWKWFRSNRLFYLSVRHIRAKKPP